MTSNLCQDSPSSLNLETLTADFFRLKGELDSGEGYLPIVCCNTGDVIPLVFGVLNVEASFSGNFMPLYASEQLCAFAGKHGSDDHLDVTAKIWLVILDSFKFLLD